MLLVALTNFLFLEVLETRGYFTKDEHGVWHATATYSELRDHRVYINLAEW